MECKCNPLEPMPVFEKIINTYFHKKNEWYYKGDNTHYERLLYNDTRLIVEKGFIEIEKTVNHIVNKISNEQNSINEKGDYKLEYQSLPSIKFNFLDKEWLKDYIEIDNASYTSFYKPYKLTVDDIINLFEECFYFILKEKIFKSEYTNDDLAFIFYKNDKIQKCRVHNIFHKRYIKQNYIIFRYDSNFCIFVGLNTTFKIIYRDENFESCIEEDILIVNLNKQWEIQLNEYSIINIPTIDYFSTKDETIAELNKAGYTWDSNVDINDL